MDSNASVLAQDRELWSILQETLNGYLCTYEQLSDSFESYNRRIKELTSSKKYAGPVKN